MTKIQKATLWLMALYLVWEASVQYWDEGANIRIDLLLIYPILLVLVLISAWQYFRK